MSLFPIIPNIHTFFQSWKLKIIIKKILKRRKFLIYFIHSLFLRYLFFTYFFPSRVCVLIGHRSELSNCIYNFDCSLIASSSMDKTAKVWDTKMNSCLVTFRGHDDEVLDLTFDNNGKKLATASSDTTARVWDVSTNFKQLALMKGHREEVSKGDSTILLHIIANLLLEKLDHLMNILIFILVFTDRKK